MLTKITCLYAIVRNEMCGGQATRIITTQKLRDCAITYGSEASAGGCGCPAENQKWEKFVRTQSDS